MAGRLAVTAGIILATPLMLLAPASAAPSRSEESWGQCTESDADVSIYGCSALLQSGEASGPNRRAAFYNRGIAYRHKGQNDLAIQDFDQAIRLRPTDAEAFNNRAIAYDEDGKFDRAIQDFAQAIRLKPDYAEAYYNRGNAYHHKSQFERSMQAGTPRPNVRGAARQMSANERAIRDYDQAIHLKPDYAAAFVNRGIAYYDEAQYARAIHDYDQAIRVKPDLAEAFNNRALAFYKTNQYPRALPDFDQTIRLNKNYGNALINRALGPSEAPIRLPDQQ